MVDEYSYSIDKEIFFPDINFDNGEVIFKSRLVKIRVAVDKTYIDLEIGRRKLFEVKWYQFIDVMKFFAPEIDDVNLESEETRKLLLPLAIEARMRHSAMLLQKYCSQIVKGDFSMESRIKEIMDNRVREILKRSYRKE